MSVPASPRIVLRRWTIAASPWLFLLPALVIFALFKYIPMAKGLDMSLYKVNFGTAWEWVGLQNFRRAWDDADLHAAVGHTAAYVAITVIVSALLGFALALLLEGSARHLRVIRTAIFLPAVTSAAVLAEIWRILLAPTPYGVANTLLGWLSVGTQPYFDSPDQALGSLMAMAIWKTIPYDMMIFLAGLAGVNRELHDAASVDGANAWRRLWHITLPSLRHTFVIVGVLGFIRGFRVFTEVYATTGGGPGGATEVIMTHVYKIGFVEFDYGYAAAISFVLFAFTAAATTLYLGWTRRHARGR
jgi:multiple sugar transport system permease protein